MVSQQKLSLPPEQEAVPEPEIQNVVATVSDSKNSINATNSANSTEVVMPQMGESITEGTVSKWLKSVGDKIEKG